MKSSKRDKNILKGLLGFGFLLLSWLLYRKRPLKDWVIVFAMKGVYASFLDSLVVRKKWVAYPVRFLKKAFRINILFDYLLLPIVCIFYNQITYHSKLPGILGKALFFSIPMTIMEAAFEKKTKLVKWKGRWTWHYTLISVTLTLWLDRVFIAMVRRLSSLSARERQD